MISFSLFFFSAVTFSRRHRVVDQYLSLVTWTVVEYFNRMSFQLYSVPLLFPISLLSSHPFTQRLCITSFLIISLSVQHFTLLENLTSLACTLLSSLLGIHPTFAPISECRCGHDFMEINQTSFRILLPSVIFIVPYVAGNLCALSSMHWQNKIPMFFNTVFVIICLCNLVFNWKRLPLLMNRKLITFFIETVVEARFLYIKKGHDRWLVFKNK